MTRRDWALLALVLVIAALVRLPNLGSPSELVFDENYYAQDACFYVLHNAATCGINGDASFVHPPLGKWLIGLGIISFGYNAFGWRITAALAGVLLVGLAFLLARRLTRSGTAGVVAGIVVALDPLSVASSRVAMLDIFTTAASVAMVLFAVLDRDAPQVSGGQHRGLVRPWHIAAGLAAGVAVATKWSGALVLVAVICLVIVWELASVQRSGGGIGQAVRNAAPSVLLWLVALPAAIYVASYIGRLPGTLLTMPWAPDSWLRYFGHRQLEMLRFHVGLMDTHPYASPAWSWPLGKRAVAYYFTTDAAGRYREILAFADPVIWLPGLAAGLVAAGVAFWRRALWGPELVVAVGVAAPYVPWLVLNADRSFIFMYYFVATVPFAAIALGWAVTRAPPLPRRVLATAVAGVSLAVIAFWAPLVYGWPLDYEGWRSRIVFADCTPYQYAADGRLLPAPKPEPAPPGWCWV